MPIFYQHDLSEHTRLAIWKIEEDENFFLEFVPLQRSITHPHKRLQHLAGRYLLTHLFPQFPINLIQIADTRKPFLRDEVYHFSISHCGDYAAAVVSATERVGIDIEITSPKILKIAHKFLHCEERQMLRSCCTDLTGTDKEYVNIVTLLWSAKEAMFKWWGGGGVDFSEMLRVSGSLQQEEGLLSGRFIKHPLNVLLQIQYKKFEELNLAWVQSAP